MNGYNTRMKQQYYTEASIGEQAAAFLAEVAELRKEPIGDLSEAALLVLDMQAYFLDPGSHAYVPSAPAILPGVNQLIERFAEEGKLVVFTQHTNTVENAESMAFWWNDLITADHPLYPIAAAVPTGRGVVIQKPQYDAFYHTELEQLLHQRGVAEVVICGVMTHLCCETTARAAFTRGFRVWFTVDGTASYNQDFHRATLLNLAHGFAAPVLVSEVLAAL